MPLLALGGAEERLGEAGTGHGHGEGGGTGTVLGLDNFASRVELGPNGVEKINSVGEVNEYEQGLLDACLNNGISI
jgi:hypothetical protein